MLKSTSSSLILLGVLAIIVGIIAIAWPGVTILALVILFAVYAFVDAGLQVARAFSGGSAGPVFGHLLLGLIDIAAGVIALVWPGPTALVLVLIVGIWAFIGGFAEIFAGFGTGLYQLVKKVNCHEPSCWRVGTHPAAGGQFMLCYRHHPDYMGKKPTHELIHRLHAEHQELQATIHGKRSESHQHMGGIDTGKFAHPDMRGPDGR